MECNSSYTAKTRCKLTMMKLLHIDRFHVEGEWHRIWNVNFPHKARNLLWRICRECVPTHLRLQVWDDLSLVWCGCWGWLTCFCGLYSGAWEGRAFDCSATASWSCEQFGKLSFWYMSFRKLRHCWSGDFTSLTNLSCTQWCHLEWRSSCFNEHWEDNTRCMVAMARGS